MVMPHAPGGLFDGPVHRYAVRAYFEDTDLSGVVYHANYLRWFERARSDMMHLKKLDQKSVFAAGQGVFAIADIAIRYLAPARLDDIVVIESRLERLGAASSVMNQRASRDQTLLCEATVRAGFVSPEGKPCRFPDSWRKAFSTLLPANTSKQAESIP